MFARKLSTGIVAATMTVGAFALTAGPASAAADADDTTYQPGATTDLIGVGSDTTQNALKRLGDAYDNQSTAPAAKIVSWSATGGGNIALPDGSSIARPVNSGAGKGLLYGPYNGSGTTGNPNIDFARSSSAENTNEQNAGLQSFPFAVDTLEMVKSGTTASHAPASLSLAQILDIYTGKTTDWSQVGGTAGTIKPYIPPSGSGTRNFFVAQLTAANGGSAPVFASSVTEAQEHDPSLIQGNADAIAPFSLAKQRTLATPSVVAAEPGFTADRAVYNVVRGTDVNNAAVLAAFGSNGFVCSSAGKTLIEQAGFRQLLPPSQGGVCGQPTQGATSNLTTAQAATSTSVAVSSATSSTATAAKIVAKVTSTSAPSGTVSFYEGSNLVAANVPLVSGAATRTQPATVGAHSYRAVFTPAANTAFTGSEGTGSGTVSAVPVTTPPATTPKKAKAKLREAFKPKYVVGKAIIGKVTVGLAGTSKKSSGSVKVLLGKKVVGKGKLKSSKALIVLRHLKLGKNKLTLVWGGNSYGAAGKKSFIITIVKA